MSETGEYGQPPTSKEKNSPTTIVGGQWNPWIDERKRHFWERKPPLAGSYHVVRSMPDGKVEDITYQIGNGEVTECKAVYNSSAEYEEVKKQMKEENVFGAIKMPETRVVGSNPQITEETLKGGSIIHTLRFTLLPPKAAKR